MSNGKIDDRFPIGQHVTLRCKNHPEKRWSTKNISPIGSRTLFYNLRDYATMGPECECDISLLEVVPDEVEVVSA